MDNKKNHRIIVSNTAKAVSKAPSSSSAAARTCQVPHHEVGVVIFMQEVCNGINVVAPGLFDALPGKSHRHDARSDVAAREVWACHGIQPDWKRRYHRRIRT